MNGLDFKMTGYRLGSQADHILVKCTLGVILLPIFECVDIF